MQYNGLAYQLNNKGYYARSNSRKKDDGEVFLHRQIWVDSYGKIPDGLTIDHINNDKTDNRLENLQLLTRADNSAKGRVNRAKKYIKHGNKFKTSRDRVYVGLFSTICGAVIAYNFKHLLRRLKDAKV